MNSPERKCLQEGICKLSHFPAISTYTSWVCNFHKIKKCSPERFKIITSRMTHDFGGGDHPPLRSWLQQFGELPQAGRKKDNVYPKNEEYGTSNNVQIGVN